MPEESPRSTRMDANPMGGGKEDFHRLAEFKRSGERVLPGGCPCLFREPPCSSRASWTTRRRDPALHPWESEPSESNLRVLRASVANPPWEEAFEPEAGPVHGPASMTDCFALLGEPRCPWLDAEALKSRFLVLSAEAHPDRDRKNVV